MIMKKIVIALISLMSINMQGMQPQAKPALRPIEIAQPREQGKVSFTHIPKDVMLMIVNEFVPESEVKRLAHLRKYPGTEKSILEDEKERIKNIRAFLSSARHYYHSEKLAEILIKN